MISPKFGDENSKNIWNRHLDECHPLCLFHSNLVPPILAAIGHHLCVGTFLIPMIFVSHSSNFRGSPLQPFALPKIFPKFLWKNNMFPSISCHPFVKSSKSTPLKTNILNLQNWGLEDENSFWNRSMLMFHEFSWLWVSTQLEKNMSEFGSFSQGSRWKFQKCFKTNTQPSRLGYLEGVAQPPKTRTITMVANYVVIQVLGWSSKMESHLTIWIWISSSSTIQSLSIILTIGNIFHLNGTLMHSNPYVIGCLGYIHIYIYIYILMYIYIYVWDEILPSYLGIITNKLYGSLF